MVFIRIVFGQIKIYSTLHHKRRNVILKQKSDPQHDIYSGVLLRSKTEIHILKYVFQFYNCAVLGYNQTSSSMNSIAEYVEPKIHSFLDMPKYTQLHPS